MLRRGEQVLGALHISGGRVLVHDAKLLERAERAFPIARYGPEDEPVDGYTQPLAADGLESEADALHGAREADHDIPRPAPQVDAHARLHELAVSNAQEP